MMKARKIGLLLMGLSLGPAMMAADFSREIAEVKAGQRTEAKASWWGFDRENATKCLQAAINSGVKKLVIDQTGSEWLIDPVRLVGNQEIVIGRDVTVRARPGGFKNKHDYLFWGRNCENLTIRGEAGAALVMNRADYQDKSRYVPSEWRHALALSSCKNLTIRDLTITGSGGDGIYLGADPANRQRNYCENVLIENVVLKDHHRQGISVISAENLLIRNCSMDATSGASPQAGLDFEPNYPTERLVNCVVENCRFRNNRGAGILFALMPLNQDSIPVSITVRNCVMTGNRENIHLIRLGATTRSLCRGKVEFIDCRLSQPQEVTLKHDFAPEFPVIFRNCVFDCRGSKNKEVIYSAMPWAIGSIGGQIVFDRVNILDDQPGRRVLNAYLAPARVTADFGGTLTRNGKPYPIAADWKKLVGSRAVMDDFKLASADLDQLKAPVVKAPVTSQPDQIYFRHSPVMLLAGTSGQRIQVTAIPEKLGAQVPAGRIVLKSPDGKILEKYQIQGDKPIAISFVPQTTGLYRIEGSTAQRLHFQSSHAGQGMLMNNRFQLLKPKGKLYFQVPAGVGKFQVAIWGDPNELVTASLVNPQGKTVQTAKQFDSARIFIGSRPKNSQSEIWAVDIASAVEDVSIQLLAPLVPVASATPELLLRLEN